MQKTYYFPQEGFDLREGNLTFHGVSLKHLIQKHGTPFRFIYLPKMGDLVYLTIDLDVLDHSIMPSTGTPEPGGQTLLQASIVQVQTIKF